MTVEKKLNNHLKALTPILDEYMEWFMQLVCRVVYPQGNHQEKIYSKPTSLEEWLEEAKKADFEEEPLNQLGGVCNNLNELSDKLINEALKTKESPEYEDFSQLINLFELLIRQIRRVERDMLLENKGLDFQTGLRTFQMLEQDFDIEMERLSRQGKPFSVALLRITNYSALEEQKDKYDIDGVMKKIADMIVDCMRNFDDAYRISKNEFVLCLKQSDKNGGVMAMERFRKSLERHQKNGDMFVPEIVSCISEPAPGEILEQLIESLKIELDEHSSIGSGVVLEHVELSPLQKFIKKGGQ